MSSWEFWQIEECRKSLEWYEATLAELLQNRADTAKSIKSARAEIRYFKRKLQKLKSSGPIETMAEQE